MGLLCQGDRTIHCHDVLPFPAKVRVTACFSGFFGNPSCHTSLAGKPKFQRIMDNCRRGIFMSGRELSRETLKSVR